IDFTRDKMTWTELDHTPKLPLGMGGKGGGQGGLEMFGSVMKAVGGFLGRRAAPEVTLRGFFGLTLIEGDEFPKIEGVLTGGPASKGGLQAGDVVTKVQGRSVSNVSDVLKLARRVAPGTKVA